MLPTFSHTRGKSSTHSHNILQELRCLASEDSGWHFKASNTSTKQLEDFNLKKMARDMEDSAPEWWSLLGVLLLR